MINSMTGYGKGQVETLEMVVGVEIRSVNHRFCDISIKAPRFLMAQENEIRKKVSSQLQRGKIDIFIQVEQLGQGGALPTLNRPLAEAYIRVFDELRATSGLLGDVPLAWLAGQKDVVVVRESSVDDSVTPDLLFQALDLALTQLQLMRQVEGEAMKRDIAARLTHLRGFVDTVALRAPETVHEWQTKLKDRLARLPEGVAFDPQRVAQEVAIFADRCDICEETARFLSHLDQFEALFTVAEPVGRKMDFLSQELNREVNTMGSKSNDAELTRTVVAIKAELEKVREQVQNIE
jgi:uncharacterized protein (TIGR00255 family)